MTHTLLVTNPVLPRNLLKIRKVYSLYQHCPVSKHWTRVTESSFELNTARYVYSERIFNAYQNGKMLDIREVK